MRATSEKPVKEISGTIVGELSIGSPAQIRTDRGIVQTSPIVHFILNPSGSAWIETKHTKYRIN